MRQAYSSVIHRLDNNVDILPDRETILRVSYPGHGYHVDRDKRRNTAAHVDEAAERLQMSYPCRDNIAGGQRTEVIAHAARRFRRFRSRGNPL